MGDYTYINLVRSGTGFSLKQTPSGTTNFCIQRGEAALKKYLGITPATANISGTNFWVRDAATSFAAHYLAMRLATQGIANVTYQRQTQRDRNSPFIGQSLTAEAWWNMGIRICDMHGRDIVIQRIEHT